MALTHAPHPDLPTGPAAPAERHHVFWAAVALIEIGLATVAVLRDLFIPTILILGLAALSLLARRRGPSTLGFHRVDHGWRMAAQVFVVMVVWSLLQLALFMPVLNHVTGEKQDLSGFADLEGSVGLLAAYLLATWTLAALGEETVFRGYLQTRITDVMGSTAAGVAVAVMATSLLFGVLHSEQGLIGVLVVALDAVLFSALRLHYRSLWAAVLAHGFNNSIGLVAFFLVGPIYGFW
jgi:membrane protease YdiL (CAAX protease family)